jgi:hypothetical protein
MKMKMFRAAIMAARKKIAGTVIIAAIVLIAGWNMIQSKSDSTLSDVTMVNVEALAISERTGGFPACQKNKGSGDMASIPFCVNGSCQNNTWENKGTLDVNYCNQ